MARSPLILTLVVGYLALAFGLRLALHRRRTGSTGFRGIAGPPGSAAWLGGVLFVVAMLGSAVAPLLAWASIDPPLIAPRWVDVVGAGAIALGTLALLVAQGAMGASWRIGVDVAETTALVSAGPFAVVRNPVFASMMLAAAGLLLLLPTVTAAASLALLVLAVELQVRVVEEPYLIGAHGEAYRAYAARVGRFVPGLGRGPAST